jgi:hypothetical protein
MDIKTFKERLAETIQQDFYRFAFSEFTGLKDLKII